MIKEVFLVKSFTKDPEQGSPTGVILDASGLTEEQMIAGAAKLGFSESAFLFPSTVADRNIRFFSPNQEVNLCGYATIASFHTLVETGAIVFDDKEKVTKTQETKAGILHVTCYKDGLIVMTQAQPQFLGNITDRNRVATLLSLNEDSLLDHPIQIVSTGTPKVIIPIKSMDRLFAIKPDLEGMKQFCKETGALGFYPFTFETVDQDSDFHARQFNPVIANDEDPITGIAAGALGAYIVKHNLSDKTQFVVEQGYIMNKRGKMYVSVGDEVQVGGYAVTFGKQNLEL